MKTNMTIIFLVFIPNCLFSQEPVFNNALDISTSFNLSEYKWSLERGTVHVGDFNNDGCNDIILRGRDDEKCTYLLYGSRSSIFNNAIDISDSFGMSKRRWGYDRRECFIGDFNGDNFSDILLQGEASDNDNYILLGKSSGFSNVIIVTNEYNMDGRKWGANRRKLIIGDYNGDNKDDILLQGTDGDNATYLLISHTTKLFNDVVNITNLYNMSHARWNENNRVIRVAENLWPHGYKSVGDFDGDGKDDIILRGINSNHHTLILYGKNGSDYISSFNNFEDYTFLNGMNETKWHAGYHRPLVGDFNCDGVDDLFYQGFPTGADNKTYIIYGYRTRAIWPSDITNSYGMSAAKWEGLYEQPLLGDFNGDNRVDILLRPYGRILQGINVYTLLLINNPNGGFYPVNDITNEYSMTIGSWYQYKSYGNKYWFNRLYIGDFNGDGKDDILLQAPTTGYKTRIMLAKQNNQINKMNNTDNFELYQNYPNPFNPNTTISYKIETEEFVSLKIYNSLGQEVKTLINQCQSPNKYTLIWNATNNNGHQISNGLYICILQIGDQKQSKKLLFLK